MTLVRAIFPFVVLTYVGLAACQAQRKMMETPVVFDGVRIDPWNALDRSRQTNEVSIFYATNRPAAGTASDRSYGNGIRDELSLGEVTVRLGGKDMTWEELYAASTLRTRKRPVHLYLENATEVAVMAPGSPAGSPSPDVAAFAERINEALDRAQWKDVNVYVHGANIDFYGATVTSAEFHHFMGRHGVMVAFDWPTTQSPLTYGTDVKHATLTVPLLARFIEFLARNTQAERINLIGYSAGAQVLDPALYELRQQYADYDADRLHEILRIGEVYFAAPDCDFRAFAVDHLPSYHDMTVSTTLTVNLNDSVLALSQFIHHKVSRAGRPDLDELTEQETEMVFELARLPTFNVIDMGTAEPPPKASLKGGHAYWYASPWVSADIIIQFIFHAGPEERGLEMIDVEDDPIWYYPADYPERVVSRLLAYLESIEQGTVAGPKP